MCAMRLLKQQFFLGLVILFSFRCEPIQAQSIDFPNKPIRMIVTTPPGSAADTIARAIAQGMSEVNRQQHIVENRVGAGGIIAIFRRKLSRSFTC